jgi:glutamate synthase (NADPH/NADH) small chain
MSNSGERPKKFKVPRQKIPEQNPQVRAKNFKEVNLGYTPEQAKIEAERCLQCGKPFCVEGCPVNINIPGFIKLIREDNLNEAIEVLKDKNILPAVCGRVCPQEVQCEGKCVLGKKFEPVAIGNLERYIADWERANEIRACPECLPPNNVKVAIIGAGPAGLTCAADLVKLGYEITIFEAFHKGGGVLAYGIPEFRLPKEIVDYEIETLEMLGVKFEYNMVMGKVLTIDDLKEMDFQAIFIGIGAGLPIFMNVPGKNLKGVVSASEYLTRANLMKAYQFPKYKTPIVYGKNICVIGGGNVAMDSARSALRFGAKNVTIVYRRAMEQLPARREEVHHAEEEGVIFKLLTNPVRFIGNEQGNVKEMEVIQMRLGELDASGRARPIPIENSEFRIKCDLVIVAIGNTSNPLLTSTIPELELNKWGNIVTDENGKTNIEGIYAAGDIVSGSATVISAMGTGRNAANGIHEDLKNNMT